jgi:hypothetical protein
MTMVLLKLRMLVAVQVCLGTIDAAAQPIWICRPVLAVMSVIFSKTPDGYRDWTAKIDVDASQCATSRGLFSIRFLRLSDDGPDLEFVEPFIWKSGQMKVVVAFAASETVQHYWIEEIAPCTCRRGR